MIAAGNVDGVGVVLRQAPARDSALPSQQFRSGAWQSSSGVVTGDIPKIVSEDQGRNFGLAVSPGVISAIAHQASGGTLAWHTDAKGTWVSQPDQLATEIDIGAVNVNVAFDGQGNARTATT